jgi:hypothetical protein
MTTRSGKRSVTYLDGVVQRLAALGWRAGRFRPGVRGGGGWALERAPPNSTFYQVFVGGGAPFAKAARWSLADFTDPALTCLVVEAGRPVLWSKPEDLSYEGVPV